MWKKIALIALMLIFFGWSLTLINKTKVEKTVTETEDVPTVQVEEKKPDLPMCSKLNLLPFIFMTDPTAERPTEMNYKFISKQVFPSGRTEIYTESSCNGGWFGLCQGTIIYSLEQSNGKWYVNDIYAIE